MLELRDGSGILFNILINRLQSYISECGGGEYFFENVQHMNTFFSWVPNSQKLHKICHQLRTNS